MGNEDLVLYLRRSGTIDKKVADAMLKVDRANFVPKKYGNRAYADYALPTDKGQTISQPTIVGLMTMHLDVKKGMKVLEIGTGSGYQAAILSKLVGPKGKVYSIEAFEELILMAKNNLDKIKIKNVEIVQGDGSAGLKEKSPFDRIIVTAGAPTIPRPLLNQLKLNGKMVIPVGPKFAQELILLEKNKKIKKRSLLPVAFVPLIGKYAHKNEKQ